VLIFDRREAIAVRRHCSVQLLRPEYVLFTPNTILQKRTRSIQSKDPSGHRLDADPCEVARHSRC
jgi:hypothetical protein